jgi:hypothetical protein
MDQKDSDCVECGRSERDKIHDTSSISFDHRFVAAEVGDQINVSGNVSG